MASATRFDARPYYSKVAMPVGETITLTPPHLIVSLDLVQGPITS